jgi:hypothetical protein
LTHQLGYAALEACWQRVTGGPLPGTVRDYVRSDNPDTEDGPEGSRLMSDPVAIVARAAAQQLEAENGPGLVTEVEAVLATRVSPSAPPQYVDPVALASLVVAIAGLTWTVYQDLKKRTPKPSADIIARTIRVTRRDQGQADAPDHVVEVVVTEAVRVAADQERTED